MKTLLKTFGITNELEYFYIIADSYVNGQFLQAHEQIKELPKKNKKSLLIYLTVGHMDINPHAKEWIIKHTIELI